MPRPRWSPAAAAAPVALVGLAAALALPGATGVRASDRCGEPFGGVRPADVTFLLAVPDADTVLDSGADDGPAFGQVVSIEAAGGAAAAKLDARPGSDAAAVLVPWGFDDRCGAIRWSGPWVWAQPDSLEFFRGVLRPREAWVDGLPTFDVPSAVWEGFPHSPWSHPMSAGRRLLSAEELFDVYGRLPTAEELAARPYGAVSALVEWRRDVGGLAERYPAGVLLRRAFLAAETARLRSTGMPFAGTYRFHVESAERDTLAVFHLRTASVGSRPLSDPTAPAAGVPMAPVPAVAYAAGLVLAPTAGALASAAEGDGPCHRPLGLRARVEERPAADAPHAWPAHLPVAFVTGCLGGDATLAGLAEASPAEGESTGAPGDGPPARDLDFPGAFRQERDGRFTFRQPASLPDGTPVLLVGERIDATALPVPRLTDALPD